MKTLFRIVLLGCLSFLGQAAPFQNLDFEMGNTNRLIWKEYYSGYGPAEDLLPGWQISYQQAGFTQEIHQVGYNQNFFDPANGPANTGLFVRNYYLSDLQPPGTLRGGQILVMHFLHYPEGTYTLSQRGDIPEGASRIFLETDFGGGIAKIYLNGIYVGENYGDVSAFAGQKDVELTLIFYVPSPFATGVKAYLDRVLFIIAELEQPWMQIYYLGGWPQLRFLGIPDVEYIIETSDNEARNWTLFARFKSRGRDFIFIPTDGVPNRFFRARKAP